MKEIFIDDKMNHKLKVSKWKLLALVRNVIVHVGENKVKVNKTSDEQKFMNKLGKNIKYGKVNERLDFWKVRFLKENYAFGIVGSDISLVYLTCL